MTRKFTKAMKKQFTEDRQLLLLFSLFCEDQFFLHELIDDDEPTLNDERLYFLLNLLAKAETIFGGPKRLKQLRHAIADGKSIASVKQHTDRRKLIGKMPVVDSGKLCARGRSGMTEWRRKCTRFECPNEIPAKRLRRQAVFCSDKCRYLDFDAMRKRQKESEVIKAEIKRQEATVRVQEANYEDC